MPSRLTALRPGFCSLLQQQKHVTTLFSVSKIMYVVEYQDEWPSLLWRTTQSNLFKLAKSLRVVWSVHAHTTNATGGVILTSFNVQWCAAYKETILVTQRYKDALFTDLHEDLFFGIIRFASLHRTRSSTLCLDGAGTPPYQDVPRQVKHRLRWFWPSRRTTL